MISKFLSLLCFRLGLVAFCAAAGLFWFPPAASGLEYQVGWAFFDGFFKENNYLNPLLTEAVEGATYDDTYMILGAYPSLSLDFNEHFSAYVQPALEWTHSWEDEDSEDWDSDMIAAVAGYSCKTFSADIGIQAFHPGRGLLTYSDEPGLSLQWNGWENIYLKGEMFQVLKTSPMAVLTAGYRPGFLETVEVFGAGFHDSDDDVADVFSSFFNGTGVKTRSDLLWIGAAADVFVQKAYVSAMWIQQFGTVDLEHADKAREMDVSAFLADAEISYPVLDNLSASLFLFAASGDSQPLDTNLNAFVSPMPFNDRTAIFFNGGFARYDVDEKMTLGGVTWDGVVAPGIGLEYQLHPKIATQLESALLFSENGSWDRESRYGWETDASVRYEFYPDQHLFWEAGVLVHGDYWKEKLGYRPDPSGRLAAGLDLVF